MHFFLALYTQFGLLSGCFCEDGASRLAEWKKTIELLEHWGSWQKMFAHIGRLSDNNVWRHYRPAWLCAPMTSIAFGLIDNTGSAFGGR